MSGHRCTAEMWVWFSTSDMMLTAGDGGRCLRCTTACKRQLPEVRQPEGPRWRALALAVGRTWRGQHLRRHTSTGSCSCQYVLHRWGDPDGRRAGVCVVEQGARLLTQEESNGSPGTLGGSPCHSGKKHDREAAAAGQQRGACAYPQGTPSALLTPERGCSDPLSTGHHAEDHTSSHRPAANQDISALKDLVWHSNELTVRPIVSTKPPQDRAPGRAARLAGLPFLPLVRLATDQQPMQPMPLASAHIPPSRLASLTQRKCCMCRLRNSLNRNLWQRAGDWLLTFTTLSSSPQLTRCRGHLLLLWWQSPHY